MPDVVVRPVRPEDRTSWHDMRAALYGEDPSLLPEIEAFFAGHSPIAAVFVAEDRVPVGFLELGLRNCAEGCRTSPVAYVEGLYVAADYRRRKIGRSLIRAAEDWATGPRSAAIESSPAMR
jgi:aminoglycoside 6'-N-acetyltransferase I